MTGDDHPHSDPEALRCTCASVRRAARRLTRLYDEALRPLGLRLTQYSMLNTVDRTGTPDIGELAELLETERTTLTRNLRPLLAAGWLRVSPGRDRRRRRVAITDAGRSMLAAARPAWRGVELRIRDDLGEGAVADLHRLNQAVLDLGR